MSHHAHTRMTAVSFSCNVRYVAGRVGFASSGTPIQGFVIARRSGKQEVGSAFSPPKDCGNRRVSPRPRRSSTVLAVESLGSPCIVKNLRGCALAKRGSKFPTSRTECSTPEAHLICNRIEFAKWRTRSAEYRRDRAI